MERFRMSRRRFLVTTATAGVLGTTGYWFSRQPVRLALIGAGTQGNGLAQANGLAYWFGGLYGQIVAVCDVDRNRASATRNKHCPEADIYGDYRRVLERDDVRAVLIATPDHWHARIAIDAMKAGKAVYCEKPLDLTIAEGQLLVQTVRATGAVFLGGTQQRTAWKFRTACELVRNGRLGRLKKITVTLPRRWQAEFEGPFQNSPPPPELDWEQWLGQAPLVEYCPQRCHGSFRRWYEYSGGQMTDWGAHHMDIAHWAMGLGEDGPLTIEGQGQMPHVVNGFSTPIEFTVDMGYSNGVHLHVRTDPDYDANGLLFEGEESSLFVNRERIEGRAYDEYRRHWLVRNPTRLHQSPTCRANTVTHHLRHFYACICCGEQPVSDVVAMHRSATACHLANIALRLGRKLTWDAKHEQIIGDPEANAMQSRPQRAPFEVRA
jgi:predicted dehydrogenase